MRITATSVLPTWDSPTKCELYCNHHRVCSLVVWILSHPLHRSPHKIHIRLDQQTQNPRGAPLRVFCYVNFMMSVMPQEHLHELHTPKRAAVLAAALWKFWARAHTTSSWQKSLTCPRHHVYTSYIARPITLVPPRTEIMTAVKLRTLCARHIATMAPMSLIQKMMEWSFYVPLALRIEQ